MECQGDPLSATFFSKPCSLTEMLEQHIIVPWGLTAGRVRCPACLLGASLLMLIY